MYKYYKKNEYDVMEYDFNSIVEFLNYLDNGIVNYKVFYDELASKSNDYNFFHTHSYEEAYDLCKFGYHKDFDDFVDVKRNLEKHIKMKEVLPKQFNDYIGYVPDVKAYIEGSPLSMFNKKTVKKEHIDIYFNIANPWFISQKQIYNKGVVTLSIIEKLERMGFSVGLNLFEMSSDGYQIMYSQYKLKKEQERLNIQKLYFPMCHPSFLRRLIFRLVEITPDISSDWKNGYGRPSDKKMIKEFLNLGDKDIIIGSSDEMNVNGIDIVEDANKMFEYINKEVKDKSFHLEKIKKKI